MRTHREEQRRREAERRALDLRRREEEERCGREAELRAADGRGRDGERRGRCVDAGGLGLSGGEDVIGKEDDAEVLADWNADRPESQDARDAAAEQLDPFDLDQDLEQELLDAELTVDIKSPAHLAVGDIQDKLEKDPKTWVASQETDYGDLDVTVEELDDFL